METPFIGALTGTHYVQQFLVKVHLANVSPANPDNTVDWSRYYPISGAGSVYYKNKTSYVMQYNFTVERQVGDNAVFSIGYIGSLGRHLLTAHNANLGNPALCLSLSQQSEIAPGFPDWTAWRISSPTVRNSDHPKGGNRSERLLDALDVSTVTTWR